MAEETLRFNTGQVVAGKYMIERQIGAGGMGIVAVATHLTLGQRVAIKFLNKDAMESPDIIARFEREAKACVQLKSEHVARVIDVGTMEHGAPFMVMEYLEGKDLSSLLEEGQSLPPGIAVDYLLQACEAIAEAHRLGIVHRDLKPANLFLTQRVDGRALIKVLDFGISKVQAESIQDTKLTSTTAIIGSPSYMSPEQLRASRDVDQRGDIWSLGVILFELLTNTLPFISTNVMELCMKVATEPVPRAETRRADLPTILCDVVARCLEKDPAQRFQSVSELVLALEPYQDEELSTTAERIRRVQGGVPIPLPSYPSSNPSNPFQPGRGTTPLGGIGPGGPGAMSPGAMPSAGSSARVQVHGGTSVSWGKTEASIPPPAPKRTSPFVWIAIAGIAVLFVGGGSAAGAVLYVRHKAAASQPELLPRDRTNLPPMAGSGVPPVQPGSIPAVNPMPDDRASLTQPAVTTNGTGSGTANGPSVSKGDPSASIVSTSPIANGAGTAGKRPAGGGGGKTGKGVGTGTGTGDVLPDARK